MKKINLRIASLSAALVVTTLLGCSKPTDTVIPTDLSQGSGEFANKIKSLSEEDKNLLAAYLVRAKVGEAFGGKPMPVGVTVGQAIEDQRKWAVQKAADEAAQAQLKRDIAAKQAAAAAELSKTVVMAYLGGRYVPADFSGRRYEDNYDVSIGIKNSGEKEIKGVRGRLVIKNTFGDTVANIRVSIEEAIAPGQQYVWQGAKKLNKFDDDDRKLMNLEEGKFTTDVSPSLVVYADGTKAGVDE